MNNNLSKIGTAEYYGELEHLLDAIIEKIEAKAEQDNMDKDEMLSINLELHNIG